MGIVHSSGHFSKIVKNIFKICSYIQKLIPDPICTLKITNCNTKHTQTIQQYISNNPNFSMISKKSDTSKRKRFYYKAELHNSYFIYFVEFVYFIHLLIYYVSSKDRHVALTARSTVYATWRVSRPLCSEAKAVPGPNISTRGRSI